MNADEPLTLPARFTHALSDAQKLRDLELQLHHAEMVIECVQVYLTRTGLAKATLTESMKAMISNYRSIYGER